MNKIKLIIFDLSGVCFSNEEPPFVRDFAVRNGLPVEEFEKRYDELIKKAERDEISGFSLWKSLLSEFKISGWPKEIVSQMIAEKKAYLDNLEVPAKLKPKYEVVYLTNYNKDYWDIIKNKFDFSQWFSWGVVSYEIKFRKPAKEGFEYILNRSKVLPEEAVFIDDAPKNIEQARELGIQTLLFENKEKLISDLIKLGVTIS